MKIGVMTFHWANNYGAVLQSYALTTHLRRNGHQAELINYIPRRAIWTMRFFDLYLKRFENLKKIPIFKNFQKKLPLSPKAYYNHKDLLSAGGRYDAVITGSDQIWNESFLMTAEKTPTASYYLDFVPPNVRRLSYAASFGTNEITENLRRYGVVHLKQFDAVSVRENNAVEMLAQEDVAATSVCDPTLLLSAEDYASLVEKKPSDGKVDVFNFMLRTKRESSTQSEAYVLNHCFKDSSHLGAKSITVGQWLWKLQHCDFVVTDSFHCTVFAILFHKPFLAVNDRNCSMNARIKTLTQRLGLENRVIEEYDPVRIEQIVADDHMDWNYADQQRSRWAAESTRFLQENL